MVLINSFQFGGFSSVMLIAASSAYETTEQA